MAGSSSADIRLSAGLKLTATVKLPFVVHENTTFDEFMDYPEGKEALDILLPNVAGGMLGGEHFEMEAVRAMVNGMPLRQIRSFGGITDEQMYAAIESLNKNFGGSKWQVPHK